tara:strand:- start:30 stop:230 length:201 start_codon:yes stop_codon:yes gene_type:complete
MNNISGALNDIKKYYDIKEIKNLKVKFGKTTIIRFASEDKKILVYVGCYDSEKDLENNGESNENIK